MAQNRAITESNQKVKIERAHFFRVVRERSIDRERVIIAIGCFCSSYEIFKHYLTSDTGEAPSTFGKLLCGGLAGVISQTLTYPLDLLRRRMQVCGLNSMGYAYTSSWDCIRTIIKLEGVAGLYKGMYPNLIKVGPSIGTSFAVYELVKDFLDEIQKEENRD